MKIHFFAIAIVILFDKIRRRNLEETTCKNIRTIYP